MQSAPTKTLRLWTSRNTPNEVVRCTTPRIETNSAGRSCANVFAGSTGELIVHGRDFPNREFPLRRDCPARGVHRKALGGETKKKKLAGWDAACVRGVMNLWWTPGYFGLQLQNGAAPTSRAEFRRGRWGATASKAETRVAVAVVKPRARWKRLLVACARGPCLARHSKHRTWQHRGCRPLSSDAPPSLRPASSQRRYVRGARV